MYKQANKKLKEIQSRSLELTILSMHQDIARLKDRVLELETKSVSK